jgi:hypothetical protein
MIPETSARRTVELWPATRFPTEWQLDRLLLKDVDAVDATLATVEGQWWMFVNIAPPGGSTLDELHLFRAATPLGPWLPHRRNPVKSDVRGARPAGRLYLRDGRWFRPGQDSSLGYGHSMVIHRIERIDDEAYEEAVVATIAPTWLPDQIATHTINARADVVVADARIRRLRWAPLAATPLGPAPTAATRHDAGHDSRD